VTSRRLLPILLPGCAARDICFQTTRKSFQRHLIESAFDSGEFYRVAFLPAAQHPSPSITPLTPAQGLREMKNAMFTSNQMQQIEQASAALASSGDAIMSRQDFLQLYDQVCRAPHD
jgi:hypothetical protein